jgi:hypothetical protein
MTATDRACEFLDRASAGDPSRAIIMDLLDALSQRDGEIERLRGPSPNIPAMRDAAVEIARLRTVLQRLVDLAESYPDAPADIREQVATLCRNNLASR